MVAGWAADRESRTTRDGFEVQLCKCQDAVNAISASGGFKVRQFMSFPGQKPGMSNSTDTHL